MIGKKILSLVTSIGLLAVMLASPCAVLAKEPVKNIIIMVPDGTGLSHTTLARWYQGGEPLALDEIAAGLVKTHSAESVISDSAPAATAMATGFKSNNEHIGVLSSRVTIPGVPTVKSSDQRKPVANVLEGAKLLGKATGLVATSIIQHATPASFSAHTPNRRDYEGIGEQQVYQEIDVMLGGGRQYLLPPSLGGVRQDGENLVSVLQGKGYYLVQTREELLQSNANKLVGLFAEDAMNHDFDRNPELEPSLAEMTQKAIQVLAAKPNGFFLFVEGSNIDPASHANDPIGVISDVLAFDRAVKVVLEFAKKDGNTLVLIAPDHGNGGMSIGNKDTDKNYDETDLPQYLGPLKKARLTGKGVATLINKEKSNIAEVMARHYGLGDLSQEEINAIAKVDSSKVQAVVGPMISKRAYIGWTTIGHTGEDMVLYAYGPNRPTGVIDNTELAKIMAENLGLNLKELNSQLFQSAEEVFMQLGASVQLNLKDANNPLLEVTKGKAVMKLPINTNLLIINNQVNKMRGLTIRIDGKVYVPKEAVSMFSLLGDR